MSGFDAANFDQLMNDVRQMTTLFEEVFAAAPECKEKELLGFCISSMKEGTMQATTAVPQAMEVFEAEARRVVAESEALKGQMEKELAKYEEMAEEDKAKEREREAKAPKLEELVGLVQMIDGHQLSQELFQKLQLAMPVKAVAAVKPTTPGEHGDLWDWLK